MPRQYARKRDGKISNYEPPTGKPRGRASKLTDDLKEHAYTHSEIGLNNSQIAEELGIPWGTFSRWMKRFPDFRAKLDEHRNLLLKDAQKCLALRIRGYTYSEKEVTEMEVHGVKKTTKKVKEIHAPPDTKAAMYILDRRSKQFRRKPEVIEEEGEDETFNVYVVDTPPPKKEKK